MKPKVLFLYNYLFHYRIPIWNILTDFFDLTVAYTYPAKQKDIDICNFETKQLHYNQYSKFVWHKENIFNLCKNYDVVVADGQISFIKYSLLGFRKRNFKLLYWCIGAPAGYNRHYGDGSKFYFWSNDMIHKKADAMIFYSQRAVDLHIERGFSHEELFVANNTVQVLKEDYNATNRNTILFIGTLYLEKGLQLLLDSYKRAYERYHNIINLTIVGGGVQFDMISDWVEQNGLLEKINMVGPVYDINKKAEYFRNSLACISPCQAGLSVLESMGYGVPFITSNNAITGGESFNIENGDNGLLVTDISKLDDIIQDITLNPQKYIDMGKKAYNHYWSCRKPEDMANGIKDAINYTLQRR